VTLAVKPWSLAALSFLVFRPLLAGRRNGKARNGEPKRMRSYSAAVLAALGGAFVVTEPGLKASRDRSGFQAPPYPRHDLGYEWLGGFGAEIE
jgi:hypothetical protein